MRNARTRWTLLRMSVLGMMFALLVTGCGGVNGPTAPVDTSSTFKVEDPLDTFMVGVGSHTPDTRGRIGRLVRELRLNDEQAAALLSAYTALRTGVQDLRAQVEAGTLTREAALAAADALRQTFEAELQVILTAEQYARLEELRQHGRRHGHGHRDPVQLWTRLLAAIGASDAQVTDVLDAQHTTTVGIQALREQVRNGDITREQAAAAAEALRNDFDAALQRILTAEQYDALQALRTDHCGRRR